MASKKRKLKKILLNKLYSEATKIKCCYCNIYEKCTFSKSKNPPESLNIINYCSITPNKKRNSGK